MACIILAWGLHRVLHGDTRCVQKVMAWPHHHCGAACARCQFLGAPCPVGACLAFRLEPSLTCSCKRCVKRIACCMALKVSCRRPKTVLKSKIAGARATRQPSSLPSALQAAESRLRRLRVSVVSVIAPKNSTFRASLAKGGTRHH